MRTLPQPEPTAQQPAPERDCGTRRAYALRARLRGLATAPRVAVCGLHVVQTGTVDVVVREHGAHWRGVAVCGRAHSCPACALRRGARLARGVQAVMGRDLAQLGPAGSAVQWIMVTLTVPHQAGERLRDVQARLVSAWRKVRSGRAVGTIFAARVSATARAREATWSARAGWHPHIHLVMRSEPWTSCPQGFPLCGAKACERCTLARAWCAALGQPWHDVSQRNGRSDAATFGVHWSKPCTSADGIAGYISKLGLEVAGAALDTKAGGGASPWQLARLASRGGKKRRQRERARQALALWHEYQEAARGQRLLEVDERMAAMVESVSEQNEPLAVIPVLRRDWDALRAAEKWRADALWTPLDAAAREGAAGLAVEIERAWREARDRGLPWAVQRARPPPKRAAGAGPPFRPATQPAAA